MEIDIPSKTFLGVRFVLFGFDPVNEAKVRSKLIDGGGIDVGQYSQNCSHVIVDELEYDNPVCVAARNDGKILVTSLWVDHSFDVGVLVDATSIMYRPLKNLDGIPGAQRLVMCLTGYQRQDRDDIMTMVGLMGANFSKPLVANRVTHLICYKFEGEKYELAKKIKKIKLVNHRWLEDCLRDWELLPEANYDKSGHELEMMEIEAKDSEEEAENDTLKQIKGRDMHRNPSLKAGLPVTHESPKSASEVPAVLPNSAVHADLSDVNPKGMLSTFDRATKFHVNSNLPEVYGCQDAGSLRNVMCESTPKAAKVDNGVPSTSKTAKEPSPSESRFGSISHTRRSPHKSISPTKVVSGSATHSPQVNSAASKVNDVFDLLSSKVQEARLSTDNITQKKRDLRQDNELRDTLPEMKVSSCSAASSLKKMGHTGESCDMSVPAVNYKSQVLESSYKSPVLESKPPSSHSYGNDGCFSPANEEHLRNETANLIATASSNASAEATGRKSLNKKSSALHLVGTVETGANDKSDKKNPSPFKVLNESPLLSKHDIKDFTRSSPVFDEVEKMQSQPHHVEVVSPGNEHVEKKNSNEPADVDLPQEGSHKLVTKPVKTKKIGKKTLGTKKSANRKGSICCNKSSSLNEPASNLSDREERTSVHEPSGVHEPETFPQSSNVGDEKNEVDARTVTECGKPSIRKNDSMNDETEAPDERDELEFEKPQNIDGPEVADLPDKEGTAMETEPGLWNFTHGFNVGTNEDEMAAKDMINEPEQGNVVTGKEIALDKSTAKEEDVGERTGKGKKQPLSKAKTKTLSANKKTMKPKKDVDKRETVKESKEKVKVVPRPGKKRSGSTVPESKLESFVELEKENRPAFDGDRNSSKSVGKSVLKVMKTITKLDEKAGTVNSTHVGGILKELESEPRCFIFRGHRLQRKEYQQIVRRLKGRFCRDSHQWSYQATHFIAPDPLCRTEKFFAAAASGRWILKTDYISACNQAGKFLAEEPYEWHKKGLSEDGAINLEAPRKWRLLRQRTGHGAFYGMRIIVYGECIAPPLDTLKRVVKAGDGEILATSPPYTRFLKSGVDFAVISPGMPRADLWVQAFLQHEIPCISADYLVEFVCKPGYPLDKHVLYNTQAWAKKSFDSLANKAEKVVMDTTTRTNEPDNDSDDISCSICGSGDRGDVMLICGNESGSIGCGVGVHIDCCDPSLESVPEEDWFCSKCTASSNTKTSKRRKR